MKKNGFTLVELLAVIAILAILVAITMPSIMSSYNKAKANVFVTDAKSFMNAATSKFTSDALSHAGQTIYYSSKPNSDLNTSKLNMDSNKEYFIEMDRHGNIKRFILYDETFCFDIFTTYGESSIGNIEGTNAYNNNGEPISKTVISSEAVWDSGNDSIDISVTKNGDKIESYFVKGCEAKSHSYDDEIVADSNVNSLYGVFQKEAEEGIYVKKYEGEHKDSYTRSASYDIYHFHADNDEEATSILNKNNVLFANHCWQMIRTTDTGGVKLLYYGEVNNGKCSSNRSEHMGYGSTSYKNLSSNYYYGTSYMYDSSSKKFSLSGTLVQKKWNDSNYSSLLGMYTCMSFNSNDKCDELYLVYSYRTFENANVLKLVSNSHYSHIGEVSLNIDVKSPGYMHDAPYASERIYHNTSQNNTLRFYYGSDVSWDGTKYTLVNPVRISDTSDKLTVDTHHYSCMINDAKQCEKVGYIHYFWGGGSGMRVLWLTNGDNVNDALDNMFKNNVRDSIEKISIDKWYEKYLASYSDYLEETIYCHDRSYDIEDMNNWNPSVGTNGDHLIFHPSKYELDLSCKNVTDQFSISNSHAKLKYSVALPTLAELRILNNKKLIATGDYYWTLSPATFSTSSNYYYIYENGNFNKYITGPIPGIRPMISIKAGTKFVSGDGSTDSPYVIE